MKPTTSTLLTLLGLAFTAVVDAAGCDACNKAVITAGFSGRPAQADCSRYQTTSFYSRTVTATVTTTNTTITTTPPPSIPTYAAACSDDAAYRSVCSCLGYNSTSVTGAVTTVTTRVLPCSTFIIQATSGAHPSSYFGKTEFDNALVPQRVNATRYVQLPDEIGTIYRNDDRTQFLATKGIYEGQTNPDTYLGLFWEQSTDTSAYNNITCSIADGRAFTCSVIQAPSNNLFSTLPNDPNVHLGSSSNTPSNAVIFGAVARAAC